MRTVKVKKQILTDWQVASHKKFPDIKVKIREVLLDRVLCPNVFEVQYEGERQTSFCPKNHFFTEFQLG